MTEREGKICSILNEVIWRNSLVSKGLSCNGWLGGVGSRKSSIDCPDPESKTNLKKIYIKLLEYFAKDIFFVN